MHFPCGALLRVSEGAMQVDKGKKSYLFVKPEKHKERDWQDIPKYAMVALAINSGLIGLQVHSNELMPGTVNLARNSCLKWA